MNQFKYIFDFCVKKNVKTVFWKYGMIKVRNWDKENSMFWSCYSNEPIKIYLWFLQGINQNCILKKYKTMDMCMAQTSMSIKLTSQIILFISVLTSVLKNKILNKNFGRIEILKCRFLKNYSGLSKKILIYHKNTLSLIQVPFSGKNGTEECLFSPFNPWSSINIQVCNQSRL